MLGADQTELAGNMERFLEKEKKEKDKGEGRRLPLDVKGTVQIAWLVTTVLHSLRYFNRILIIHFATILPRSLEESSSSRPSSSTLSR